MTDELKTVLTLVVKREADKLTEDDIDRITRSLAEIGIRTQDRRCLATNEAWQLELRGGTGEMVTRLVAEALAGRPADIFCLASVPPIPRLMVSDMDSTIIGVECIDEIAAQVGRRQEVAEVTERAMRGELDFKSSLKARMRLLSGITSRELERVYAERVALNPGARCLVQTLRAHGARTVLVSGGFTLFAEPVAEQAGFDASHANRLVFERGLTAGRVEEPILGAEEKRQILLDEAVTLGINPAQSLAIGDGANDLPMMAAAGLSVGYRAREKVREVVDLTLDYCDLDALLFAYGLRREEFDGT